MLYITIKVFHYYDKYHGTCDIFAASENSRMKFNATYINRSISTGKFRTLGQDRANIVNFEQLMQKIDKNITFLFGRECCFMLHI